MTIDFGKNRQNKGLYDMRGCWYRWDKKATTDDYLCLDISTVARELPLDQTATVSWQWTFTNGRKSSMTLEVLPEVGLRLVYNYKGQPVQPYTARVVYTTPNYGGQRPWFLCPNCRKRVRILYGGKLFLCRDCHGLTYESRQSSHADALVTVIRNRKRHILKRLGSDNGGIPDKPRYMHFKTYMALVEEFVQLGRLEDDALLVNMAQLVGMSLPSVYSPREDWQLLKEARKHPSIFLHRAASRMTNAHSQKRGRVGDDESANRLTLGELATVAGVPYGFAKEAQDAGLIKPDQGRTTRRHRYRQGLATWLQKLQRIRDAGLEWDEIVAWTKRRWLPGNEKERRWPIGVVVEEDTE